MNSQGGIQTAAVRQEIPLEQQLAAASNEARPAKNDRKNTRPAPACFMAPWTVLFLKSQTWSAQRTTRQAYQMIIAIDGPAGAGKSSIASRLAERLSFAFLDTGAMYRAVALAALRSSLGAQDEEAIAALADNLTIEFDGKRTLLDGEDVSTAIRTVEVSAAVHLAADNIAVRRRLVELQRGIASGRDIVTEGRDQGTVAFPNADCKIFLTASREERARRRRDELIARGENVTYDEILFQQDDRDQRD